MSFVASVARDQMLTARNSDLTFEINVLSETLMQLQSITVRLISAGANLNPNSPFAQILQARQAQLALISKGVELRLELVKAQQRAVATELESVRKAISEAISQSFKTFATA